MAAYDPLSAPDILRRLRAGWCWLDQSIQATHQQGSAAYYQPVRGWSGAYPETTGYLIETLFNLSDTLEDPTIERSAIACADWLCRIQLADGGFPSGVGGRQPSLIFDTGQIIFGLVAAYRRTGEPEYLEVLKKAVAWVLQHWSTDLSLPSEHHFIPGYNPTYHTRVIWALLSANQLLQQEGLQQTMTYSLQSYRQRIKPNGIVEGWSLYPDKPALTHTMAYTVRGTLESGLLLQDDAVLNDARRIADEVLKRYVQYGRLAASYTSDWRGNFGYYCVTGHAQFSLVFFRLFHLTQVEAYRRTAQGLLTDILPAQCLMKSLPAYGGVSGSYPFWGGYQRFRWTNWGLKFFLDALLASRARARVRASEVLA